MFFPRACLHPSKSSSHPTEEHWVPRMGSAPAAGTGPTSGGTDSCQQLECCKQMYPPRTGGLGRAGSLPAPKTPGILCLRRCRGICCRADGRSSTRCEGGRAGNSSISTASGWEKAPGLLALGKKTLGTASRGGQGGLEVTQQHRHGFSRGGWKRVHVKSMCS